MSCGIKAHKYWFSWKSRIDTYRFMEEFWGKDLGWQTSLVTLVQLHKSPWWHQVSPSTLWIMELLSETFGKLLYNDLAESSRKDRSVIWGWKLEEFLNHFISLWTWPSCSGYDKTPAGAQLEHHDNMIRFAGGIEWSKVQNLTKKTFSFLKGGFLLFIKKI